MSRLMAATINRLGIDSSFISRSFKHPGWRLKVSAKKIFSPADMLHVKIKLLHLHDPPSDSVRCESTFI
jgi:hypothetical protein